MAGLLIAKIGCGPYQHVYEEVRALSLVPLMRKRPLKECTITFFTRYQRKLRRRPERKSWTQIREDELHRTRNGHAADVQDPAIRRVESTRIMLPCCAFLVQLLPALSTFLFVERGRTASRLLKSNAVSSLHPRFVILFGSL